MIVDVIDDLREVCDLREEWNTLFEESYQGSIFCHHSWIWHSLALTTTSKPLVLTVRREPGGPLIGVFPLCIETMTIAGMRFRALAHAAGGMADFSSFLVSSQENLLRVVKLAVSALVDLQSHDDWDFFHVSKLNDGDAVASLFRQLLQQDTYAGSIAGELTPAIDLCRSFGVTKTLREIRRRGRKLKAVANVEIEIHALPEIGRLSEFSAHHADAFPGVGFSGTNGRALFAGLLGDSYFAPMIDFSYVLVDGRLAAGHLGFCHEDRFYYYVPAFDKRLSTYGVGQLLLSELIDHYKEAGIRRFEFLRGMETYKFDWLNRIECNWTLFGTATNAPRWRRTMVDLWVARRSAPAFR